MDNHDSVNLRDGYDSGEVLVASTEEQSQDWLLDLGYTYHMTFNKDWLVDYKEINGGKVMMGNNHTCQVEGIGNVRIKMFDGVTRTLTNVKNVPTLTRNLFSLGVLDDLGYVNKIENGAMKIYKGAMVVKKGSKRNACII